MNMWNSKDLPEPPINTYKASDKKIDIKHLYDVFEEGIQFFDVHQFMYAEYVVLSRILYRMKQKFRSAKDFKALEKVNKALDNYFKMSISRNLKTFMELIPSRYKHVTYLPTKNLLDYILVRLQGSVKLMERIVETCKIAAYLLDKRMHTGHFWKIAFMTFSIVSRIYILAKHTAKFICQFYSKLIPFSSQLRNTSGWAPHYKFPNDLKEWMNVDWLEVDDEIQIVDMPIEIPDTTHFFDLVDDEDDVLFCDEYLIIKDDEDERVEKDLKKIGKTNFRNLWELRGFDTKEDVGEVIEINDSIQMLDQKKSLMAQNDNEPSPIENDHASNNSIKLVDGNIDANGDISNSKSQQEISKMSSELTEEIKTITIPDTPLLDRNGKVKSEMGTFATEQNTDRDVSNSKSQQENPKIFTQTKTYTMTDSSLVGRKKEIGRFTIKTHKLYASKSIQFNGNNVDIGVNTCVSKHETVTQLSGTQDRTVTITIPDTPLADNKKEKKYERKPKIGKNGKVKSHVDNPVVKSNDESVIVLSDTSIKELDEKQVKMKKPRKKKSKQKENTDIQSSGSFINTEVNFDSNVTETNEDPTVISLADMLVRGTIVETPVKKKKWKTKKPKQNENTNMQSSSSSTNSEYQQAMKKKKKIVKSNQNRDELKSNTKFDGAESNIVKKKEKLKKNNPNPRGSKINNRLYQTFLANVLYSDDSFIQSSPGACIANPRKRKLETDGENFEVKRIKQAISEKKRTKEILERKLLQTKQSLKKLSGKLSGELSPSKKEDTNGIVNNKKRKKKTVRSGSQIPEIKSKNNRKWMESNKTPKQNLKLLMNNSAKAKNRNKNKKKKKKQNNYWK